MLSRVADSLFWMARYLERAEHTARMLDVNLNLMLDEDPENGGERWRRLLESLDITAENLDSKADATRISEFLTLDLDSSSSILSSVIYARDNAKQLREHISSQMWEQLNRLYLDLRAYTMESLWTGQTQEFCRRVIDGVSLFNGVTQATLNQGEAWQFIQLGRYLERATNTATVVDVHFKNFYETASRETASTAPDFMEWVGLLKCCAAFEAYCQVYTADFRPDQIAEFLLLNQEFPQAICFSAGTIHSELKRIGGVGMGAGLDSGSGFGSGSVQNQRLHRLTGKLMSSLRYTQIDEILNENLHGFLSDIIVQCGHIHQAVYQSYFAYSIESAIAQK